MAFDPMPDHLP